MNNPFTNIRFSLSAASLTQLPPDRGAEVAFTGRSNAGKSSAINTITARKALARTSKSPGRTREINVFSVDETRRLVDLPGFGYARVADAIKQRWQRTLNRYLQIRRSLRGLMLVMDARHPMSPYDVELLYWCREIGLPVHVLLAKSDKLTRTRTAAALHEVSAALEPFGPGVSVQLFSSRKHEGVETAREVLVSWLDVPQRGLKKSPGNKGREPGA